MGKNIENKRINQKIYTNVRTGRQYCVEMVGGKYYDRELNQLLCDVRLTADTTVRTRTQPTIV
jgi:hypothetical protein